MSNEPDSNNIRSLINKANDAYDYSLWKKAYLLYKTIEVQTTNGHVFYRLGMMHLVGYHVTRDVKISKSYFEKAFPLLEVAAVEGEPEAQADLGYMYYNGHTPLGTKDMEMAMKYYVLAAEQSYSRALCNLGFIYYNGSGNGIGDKKKAVIFYQKAAANGSLVAHSNLGFIYKDSSFAEIKQDHELAIKHFFVAAKGNEKARIHLTDVFKGRDTEYKSLVVRYLAMEWPKEHAMVNKNCKKAILEIFNFTKHFQEVVLLPELGTEIVRILIMLWPEHHMDQLEY